MWVAAALAVYQIYQGNQQAAATEEAAARQREIDEMNARYLEIDADNAERYGYTETAAYEPTITGTIGQQRTNLAAAGVDLTTGVAAEIQAETRLIGNVNKIQMQQEAYQKAQGLRMQARSTRLGGQYRSQEASAKADAQRMDGYASAAQTGMQTYSRYGNSTSNVGKSNNNYVSYSRSVDLNSIELD